MFSEYYLQLPSGILDCQDLLTDELFQPPVLLFTERQAFGAGDLHPVELIPPPRAGRLADTELRDDLAVSMPVTGHGFGLLQLVDERFRCTYQFNE